MYNTLIKTVKKMPIPVLFLQTVDNQNIEKTNQSSYSYKKLEPKYIYQHFCMINSFSH